MLRTQSLVLCCVFGVLTACGTSSEEPAVGAKRTTATSADPTELPTADEDTFERPVETPATLEEEVPLRLAAESNDPAAMAAALDAVVQARGSCHDYVPCDYTIYNQCDNWSLTVTCSNPYCGDRHCPRSAGFGMVYDTEMFRACRDTSDPPKPACLEYRTVTRPGFGCGCRGGTD